ncbi:hypothetical protein EUX98_g337 [Antrodiella citrinella]|uniref:Uncharacterized protein n=1 Tax=Antrodiella citrinella TaxID=2447956 RepID=A0A4S4N6W3_9APHY|nr:hypothetical protein EUX98_g337 [Antrodiella citrinella]
MTSSRSPRRHGHAYKPPPYKRPPVWSKIPAKELTCRKSTCSTFQDPAYALGCMLAPLFANITHPLGLIILNFVKLILVLVAASGFAFLAPPSVTDISITLGLVGIRLRTCTDTEGWLHVLKHLMLTPQ